MASIDRAAGRTPARHVVGAGRICASASPRPAGSSALSSIWPRAPGPAQSLSASALLQHRQSPPPAPYFAIARPAPRRAPHTSTSRSRLPVARRRAPARRSAASARRARRCRRARTIGSSAFRCSSRIAAAFGAFDLRERREHGRDDALIGVGRACASSRGSAGFERQRAENGRRARRGRSSADPDRARQHRDEVFRIERGQRAKRRAREPPGWDRASTSSSASTRTPAHEAADRADRLEPDVRIGSRRVDASGAAADRPPIGSPIRPSARTASIEHRARRRSTAAASAPAAPTRSFRCRKPLDGKRPRVGLGILRQRQQRRQRARRSSSRCSA